MTTTTMVVDARTLAECTLSRLRLIIIGLISRGDNRAGNVLRREREFCAEAVVAPRVAASPGTIVRTEAASYTPLNGIGQKLKQLAQFVARTENNAGKLLTMSRRPPPPRGPRFKRCFRPNLPTSSSSLPHAHVASARFLPLGVANRV